MPASVHSTTKKSSIKILVRHSRLCSKDNEYNIKLLLKVYRRLIFQTPSLKDKLLKEKKGRKGLQQNNAFVWNTVHCRRGHFLHSRVWLDLERTPLKYSSIQSSRFHKGDPEFVSTNLYWCSCRQSPGQADTPSFRVRLFFSIKKFLALLRRVI